MSMDWFNDDGIFMPMLNDTGRNIFYKTAIEAAVPGKTVCDISKHIMGATKDIVFRYDPQIRNWRLTY